MNTTIIKPLQAVNEITANYFADHFTPRQLFSMSVEEMANLPGMNEKTATIIYESLRFDPFHETPPQIKSSKDMYDNLLQLRGLDHEQFHIIALNTAHRVIKTFKISQGGTSGTVVDVKIIAKKLLQVQAKACILAHNHPAGQLHPSHADRNITKKVKEGLDLIDINVLDHLIVTDTGYYSFSDEGAI